MRSRTHNGPGHDNASITTRFLIGCYDYSCSYHSGLGKTSFGPRIHEKPDIIISVKVGGGDSGLPERNEIRVMNFHGSMFHGNLQHRPGCAKEPSAARMAEIEALEAEAGF